jgi:hypothetical protein
MIFGFFSTAWKSAKFVPISNPDNNHSNPVIIDPLVFKNLKQISRTKCRQLLNFFIRQNQVLLSEVFGFCKQQSNSINLIESRTRSRMALVENTMRHPMIQVGLMDYCKNNSHFREYFSGKQPLQYLNVLPDFLIFKSYLEGRTFTVHLNDSSPEPPPPGLPQDAVLSTIYPLTF